MNVHDVCEEFLLPLLLDLAVHSLHKGWVVGQWQKVIQDLGWFPAFPVQPFETCKVSKFKEFNSKITGMTMARCSTLSRFLHKFFLEGLRLHKSPQEQGLGANQKKKLKSFGVPELTSLPGEKKKQRDWRLMTAWRFALPRHILHRQLCLCLEAFEDIKPGKTNDTPSTLLAPCGFKMVYGLSIYIYIFFFNVFSCILLVNQGGGFKTLKGFLNLLEWRAVLQFLGSLAIPLSAPSWRHLDPQGP